MKPRPKPTFILKVFDAASKELMETVELYEEAIHPTFEASFRVFYKRTTGREVTTQIEPAEPPPTVH